MSIQRSIECNLLCRGRVKTMCSSPCAHCVQPGYCSRCSDHATLQDGRPRVRIFYFLQNLQAFSGAHTVRTGGLCCRGRKLSGRELLGHLVSRLKTSGAVTPISLYAFTVWTETTIYLRCSHVCNTEEGAS